MRKYYISYTEDTNIKYLYLLLFYKMAEADKVNNIFVYCKIYFDSYNELTKRLNTEYKLCCPNSTKQQIVSKSTLYRFLNDAGNTRYFDFNAEKNIILLKNNFSKSNRVKFVVLTETEVNFLLLHNDELLTRYYLYIKYYCGYSRDKKTDFTAKQFLEASNYSANSGANKTKICSYNSLLSSNGLIKIEKYRTNSKERNIYSLP